MFNLFNKKVGRIVFDLYQGGSELIDFSKVYYTKDAESKIYCLATKDIIVKNKDEVYYTEPYVIHNVLSEINKNKEHNKKLFNEELFFCDYRTGENLLKEYQEKNKVVGAWLMEDTFMLYLKDIGSIQMCIQEYMTNIDRIREKLHNISVSTFFYNFTNIRFYEWSLISNLQEEVEETIKKIEEKLNEEPI